MTDLSILITIQLAVFLALTVLIVTIGLRTRHRAREFATAIQALQRSSDAANRSLIDSATAARIQTEALRQKLMRIEEQEAELRTELQTFADAVTAGLQGLRDEIGGMVAESSGQYRIALGELKDHVNDATARIDTLAAAIDGVRIGNENGLAAARDEVTAHINDLRSKVETLKYVGDRVAVRIEDTGAEAVRESRELAKAIAALPPVIDGAKSESLSAVQEAVAGIAGHLERTAADGAAKVEASLREIESEIERVRGHSAGAFDGLLTRIDSMRSETGAKLEKTQGEIASATAMLARVDGFAAQFGIATANSSKELQGFAARMNRELEEMRSSITRVENRIVDLEDVLTHLPLDG